MDVSHSRPFTRGRFQESPGPAAQTLTLRTPSRPQPTQVPHQAPRRWFGQVHQRGQGPGGWRQVQKSEIRRPRLRRRSPRRSRVHTEERKSASPRSSPTRAATRTSLPTSTYSSRSPSGSSERCSARCPVRRAWAAAARRSARNASLSWKASFPSRSGRCLRDGVQFRRSRCDASRSCPP